MKQEFKCPRGGACLSTHPPQPLRKRARCPDPVVGSRGNNGEERGQPLQAGIVGAPAYAGRDTVDDAARQPGLTLAVNPYGPFSS